MKTSGFSASFLVDQSPEEVFDAINDPRAWWSEQIEGVTDTLNGEFLQHYRDVHIAKMKIVELIPGKKVTWLVLDNYFNFIEDQREWKGTKICFEISQKGDQTKLTFTHVGLVPEYECYDLCRDAWSGYINHSLRNLITSGKGQPTPKEEDGFSAGKDKRWQLVNA